MLRARERASSACFELRQGDIEILVLPTRRSEFQTRAHFNLYSSFHDDVLRTPHTNRSTQATAQPTQHAIHAPRDHRGACPALQYPLAQHSPAPTVGSDDAPDLEKPHLLGARDEVRLPVVQELDAQQHPDEVGLVGVRVRVRFRVRFRVSARLSST